MNKGQLIESVAAEIGESKANASRLVDAVFTSLMRGIKQDSSVTIAGFGTFTQKDRAARTVRNPSTGVLMEIKPSKTVNFKASPAFKDSLAPIESG